MNRLSGKKAVVTGGSNGIGRAIVTAFAREGADVLFTTHEDIAAAEAVVREGEACGSRLHFIQMDAADLDNVPRLHREALAFLGRVEILVNNAAVISRTGFLDITPEQYRRVLDVNLQFPFFSIQLFAQHMIAEKVCGSIINISSVSAFKAVSRMAHYQCSKAALSMLGKSAAGELAPHGIRVNTLSPGLTATKTNRNQWEGDPELWKSRGQNIPMGRAGMAQDHAGAAVFLASDESAWMTGADLVIDGGEAVF